ncbi:MAG: hypothetical protein IOC96_12110 [Rhodobacter sp.]|nr:hypothetical protein [Rhodobacter sp.]MCA3523776.1 hypothetical protein [Rhodobacter sp.]MCA3528837.1 hypothetical protein [Rhodobacter sp.]MCA3531249.1 hypothetical protein [Rhodobacter sp.]MCA3534617.1 hypothetical protein [Rhodobacter sp.]
MVFSVSGAVFVWGDVGHAVKAVFDGPAGADGFGASCGGEGRGGEVISGEAGGFFRRAPPRR